MDEIRLDLVKLRNSNNLKDFLALRKGMEYPRIIDRVMLKQDFYLYRKNGEEHLYLGGCFRIIDRLIRALNLFEKLSS
jgi:hypothetical protein